MNSTSLSVEARLTVLERSLRRVRWIATALLASLVALTSIAWQDEAERSAEFDQLTVKRLDVVDESGRRRIVLANADRFPLPVLQGKEWPRSIAPAGMVFYRSDGDECGGLAMAEVPGLRKNMLILDYANSEAVAIGVAELDGGHYSAGLTLVQRMPTGSDVATVGTSGPVRIAVTNDNGNAQVVLSDALGRPRLRLRVAENGSAGLSLLDEKGEEVQSWP